MGHYRNVWLLDSVVLCLEQQNVLSESELATPAAPSPRPAREIPETTRRHGNRKQHLCCH